MSYFLTVAKGGPKLNPHVDALPPADDTPQSFGSKTDKDGYPIVPLQGRAMSPNGRARMKYPNWDVDAIASMFGSQLDAPVRNDTGLAGKYDLELKWSTQRCAGFHQCRPGTARFEAGEEESAGGHGGGGPRGENGHRELKNMPGLCPTIFRYPTF
jgi:uncharacterized protein (TIGR03435 family)